MKRTLPILIGVVLFMGIALAMPSQAQAQDITTPDPRPGLALFTTYPSQVVELGENVKVRLDLKAVGESQTVTMGMAEIPEGWSATFRGGGHIIHAVHVEAETSETFDLHLEPPENQKSGEYTFVVLADAGSRKVELPLTLTVLDKVPASLAFSIDLPTIKGSPTTTFRYNATLKNDGDEELSVTLNAESPSGFLTRFKLSGQEVTSFSLGANESKSINIEVDPLVEIPAGRYPVTVYADGGEVQANLALTAEVIGQYNLSITGPDGRLSGRATAGEENTLQVFVSNTGTAPAQGVEMSSSAPSGWEVSFEPEAIAEIPAGDFVEVTAKLKPAEKTVAGDYMVTLRARPVDGVTESAEFRITVVTSTIWGIAGIGLIAIAVGVVGVAVTRFGRR